MVHKGFSYEFSPREAAYLLFGKKVCPRCGSHLERRKDLKHGWAQNLIRKWIRSLYQMQRLSNTVIISTAGNVTGNFR